MPKPRDVLHLVKVTFLFYIPDTQKVLPAPTDVANQGMECNWRSSALQRDPASNAYFFQCVPSSPTEGCGEWTRMQCSQSTVFNADLNVCVPLAIQNSCVSSTQQPVCSCSQVSSSCPGTSQCQNVSYIFLETKS